ncbi:MAG: hypothetical protein WCH99_04095 [Verrucomicrobiota bacterium]
MNACNHHSSYTYTDNTDDGKAYLVRQCNDCHQEIVRRELNAEFIIKEAVKAAQRDVERTEQVQLLMSK